MVYKMTQSQMTDEIKLISAQLTDSTSRDERKSLTYKLSNLVFDQGYRQGNIDGYHKGLSKGVSLGI